MTWPSPSNERFRQSREARPSPTSPSEVLSRQELAELVNTWLLEHEGRLVELDANYIGKLERGQIRWPQASYRSALRATLKVGTDGDLGFRRPRRNPTRTRKETVDRNEFLRVALGAGAAMITTHPLANLAEAFREPDIPARIGSTEINELHGAVRMLDSWDNLHGGGMGRAMLGAQLRYATQLLNAECPERLRPDLFNATGTLIYTAGFMAFDTFDHVEATQRWSFALSCAQEAGDWNLRAKVLSGMARQAFWTGDYETSLTLVELSLVRADRLGPTERAMLGSLRARSLARLGRTQEALTVIGAADEEFTRADPATTPPTMTYYDAAEHTGETGHALADLAEQGTFGTEARSRLNEAISRHGDVFARSRAFCQLRLSSLLMKTGDPREAVAIAQPALTRTDAIRSRRLEIVAAELGAKALPHRAIPEVEDLRQKIMAITA